MFRKITGKSYKTAKWSGGTTTELYIFPEDSSYSKRDFLFRISSAKIETEKSVFTKLPNISRKIMVLEDHLKLEHKNHHQCVLNQFSKDSFSGDWETISFGKAKDFNLMTTSDCTGDLEHIRLLKNQSQLFKIDNSSKNKIYHFYLYDGKLEISKDNILLEENDSFVIYNEPKFSLIFTAKQDSHLIISKVVL